jgi:hypothetical protein
VTSDRECGPSDDWQSPAQPAANSASVKIQTPPRDKTFIAPAVLSTSGKLGGVYEGVAESIATNSLQSIKD